MILHFTECAYTTTIALSATHSAILHFYNKGRTTATTYYTIVLESAGGQQLTAGETAHAITSSQSICRHTDDFVADSLARPLRVWKAQWLPLVVG